MPLCSLPVQPIESMLLFSFSCHNLLMNTTISGKKSGSLDHPLGSDAQTWYFLGFDDSLIYSVPRHTYQHRNHILGKYFSGKLTIVFCWFLILLLVYTIFQKSLYMVLGHKIRTNKLIQIWICTLLKNCLDLQNKLC